MYIYLFVYGLDSGGVSAKFLMFKNKFPSEVLNKLLSPLLSLLPDCRHLHSCPELPDEDWLCIGIQRVLQAESSGRAFLQLIGEHSLFLVRRSNFFESLKSQRRLRLCQEALSKVATLMKQDLPDPLAQFSSLKDFDVFAGDGHFHAAATHDPRKGGSHRAVGHLYTLNLRTQGLSHLSVGDQINRKKEHDMHILKRLEIAQLRQSAPVGRKVLYVWDKAGIDFAQWLQWKNKGIYFLSREKDNMRLIPNGHRRIDHTTPINQGVLKDELVAPNNGTLHRRITYHCPVKQNTYYFLTNEMTLEPGLIALLYKMRWDIEKVFDEIKNRYQEKKAWAVTETAKTIQANFICLGHNLSTLFAHKIQKEEGIENTPEIQRRAKRLKQLEVSLQKQNQQLPHLYKVHQRLTQRGVKWIRWLRNHLFQNVPWQQALSSLRRIYVSL